MKGKGRDDPDGIWKPVSKADFVDIINCAHASKRSLMTLTQDNQGNSVSPPAAPGPDFMSVLTVQWRAQSKIALLSTHPYTVVDQD